MKGKFLLYSFVAAFVIAACVFFIGIQFAVGYLNLITVTTFVFAFFAYSLDHYFDSEKTKDKAALHGRHQVSSAAYKITLQGLSLAAICSTYFFYFLPRQFLYSGLFVALVSGLYFLLILKVQLPAWLKQMLSALILTMVFGVWILINPIDAVQAYLYLVILFLAILSNLLTFGFIDKEYDQKIDQQASKIRNGSLIGLLLLVTALIFGIGFYIGVGQSWMFVPFSYLIVIILIRPKWYANDSIRILIDLIMLLPMLKFLW